MKGIEVAAVGDNCIDKYLPPVGYSAVGGNAVNVAIHLQRAGLRAAYFGAVGDDADGRRMQELLASNGLDISAMQTVPGGVTAYTDIEVSAVGERRFLFEEFGVCRGYRPTADETARLRTLRHVHIGWMDDGGALKDDLLAAGVSVSQDITVNPHVEGLTIGFASAGNDRVEAKTLVDQLLARGCKLAVVTRGEHGSMASDGNEYAETDIVPVNVVDTTGAGDTFIAGFIAARLSGEGLQKSLEAGRDAAAITCTHVGGFPQKIAPLPTV